MYSSSVNKGMDHSKPSKSSFACGLPRRQLRSEAKREERSHRASTDLPVYCFSGKSRRVEGCIKNSEVVEKVRDFVRRW